MGLPKFDRAVMCATCGEILHTIRNDWLDAVLANSAVLNHIDFPRGDLPELVYHDIVTVDFFDNCQIEGIFLRKVFTD